MKQGTIQGILLAHRNSWRYYVLLHAAKLGHWTDSFTSPPKEEEVKEDFSDARKIQRLRPDLNPRTRVPEASLLTTRPQKPSVLYVSLKLNLLMLSSRHS